MRKRGRNGVVPSRGGKRSMAEKKTPKKASDLRYILYHRPLHPEFFTIRASRRIQEKYYQGSIWVIGNSHVVTVRAGSHVLVEVVMEKGREVPRRGVRKKFPIHDKGLDRIQLNEGGAISYTSEFSFKQYSPSDYRERHDSAFVGSFDQRLIHTFPPEGKDGLRPFTLLDFRAERGRLRIQTVNAFPQDLTLVTTDSTFEV